MPEKQINGSNIHYNDTGNGNPLVLLHGFPLDSRIWRELIPPLAAHARVITLDLPGFGKSTTTKPFTMETIADDVHQLLHDIGALPCELAGLSMGGYVALAYAKKYLADLRGLILIDTRSQADTPQGREARNAMIALANTKGSMAVAEQMFPKMLGPNPDPKVAAELMDIMKACPVKGIQYALDAMRDRPDSTDLLPTLALPTLIIVGESDAITPPELSRTMHQAIPGSKLSIIPSAGHMSPMEQPAAVANAIQEFLKVIPATR
jgi:3-oxoadipate enol-lactonase